MTAALAIAAVFAGEANAQVSDGDTARPVLSALSSTGDELGQCPLLDTDVRAEVSGPVARVTVTQHYENPFETPIEAVYTFPLPERSAVDSMTMRIGDRTIVGEIHRREEAEKIYQEARNAGKRASLLNQERPNIFTQAVANIMPGDAIEITISYVEYLKYEEGEYTFSFPMVVGPRYIPGVNQVPDAERITPPITPEGTRAGHTINLTVAIDAGVPVYDVRSELHEIEVETPSSSSAVVRLANLETIPNRDFILKYRVAGAAIADAVLTHASDNGGFFSLILQPPERISPKHITPKEMIFVIDCSGSMMGFPIDKAKKSMRLCIENMNPGDTFNLVTFAGGLGYCFDKPVPNIDRNREKALDYLDNLQGGGGTEMLPAIRAALGGQDDPERLRVVCFMTDGFIGNDMEILDAIQKNVATARVFAFGIGNSVNRFLVENMARLGRGAAEVITLEGDSDKAAQRFFERIHAPILTDITVDFDGLAVHDVLPEPDLIPDLFAARPLVLTGRYTKPGEGTVTLRGMTAQGPFERTIAVSLPARNPAHDALGSLWAREKIAWWMQQDWLGAQRGKPVSDVEEAVTQLGLDFGLMTQYTSFVAVEQRVVNRDGRLETITVPVEMPDGVSYEGIFGKAGLSEDKVMSFGRGSVVTGGSPLPSPSAEPMNGPARLVGDVAELQKQPVQHDREEKDEAVGKLDLALQGLSVLVAEGKPVPKGVTVENGRVKVEMTLADDAPEKLEQLRAAGVTIIAHTNASQRVLAWIPLADLETIARLDFVTTIKPAS